MAESFVFNNRRIVIPGPGQERPNPPLSGTLTTIMNKTEPEFIVFAHFVPTRIVRVTAHKDFCRFRVEKLVITGRDPANPQGNWHTEKALAGKMPGEMLNQAMQEAYQLQTTLIQQMQKRRQQMQKKQILRV